MEPGCADWSERSPFTRRVASRSISTACRSNSGRSLAFGDRAEVRAKNPLGRIPALVLDTGEVLIDSDAIIDHLDEDLWP